MTKQGAELGADLAQLWDAGHNLIPKVAADVGGAYLATPTSVAPTCARSGGLGVGDTGPGPQIEAMLSQLGQALSGTRDSLDGLGQALVWLADDYAATDAAAAAEYHRKQALIGNGGN